MGVKGDNSSLRGPGAGPMAEGEAEPHKRSRWLSERNEPRLKNKQGEHRKVEAIKAESEAEPHERSRKAERAKRAYIKENPMRIQKT